MKYVFNFSIFISCFELDNWETLIDEMINSYKK